MLVKIPKKGFVLPLSLLLMASRMAAAVDRQRSHDLMVLTDKVIQWPHAAFRENPIVQTFHQTNPCAFSSG